MILATTWMESHNCWPTKHTLLHNVTFLQFNIRKYWYIKKSNTPKGDEKLSFHLDIKMHFLNQVIISLFLLSETCAFPVLIAKIKAFPSHMFQHISLHVSADRSGEKHKVTQGQHSPPRHTFYHLLPKSPSIGGRRCTQAGSAYHEMLVFNPGTRAWSLKSCLTAGYRSGGNFIPASGETNGPSDWPNPIAPAHLLAGGWTQSGCGGNVCHLSADTLYNFIHS